MNHKKPIPFRRITVRSKSITNSAVRPIFSAWLLCFAALVSGSVLQTTAQTAGSLDTTFGTGGKVITPFDTGGEGRSVVVQTDGKIVVAGGHILGFSGDFAIARYNTNGTLDTSFGGTGKVITPVGVSHQSYGQAAAIQTNGKIIVAGYSFDGSKSNFTVLRYNTDGSLDSFFGIGGVAITSIGTGAVANSVAIQTDGKIVVAGYTNGSEPGFALVRYNTNGSTDNVFGIAGTGIVVTRIGTYNNIPNAMAIQADGKIVVGGIASRNNQDTTSYSALVRYTIFGSPDPSFGFLGIVTAPVGSNPNKINSVAIQADGKIVTAGAVGNKFEIMRYNSDGTPDTSFGGTGEVSTAVGNGGSQANSVAIQSDGKILAGGYGYAVGTGNTSFAIVRYNPDSTLDTSFGSAGIVITSISSGDAINSIAIQADGKIVVAGYSHNGVYNFGVARYNAVTARNKQFDFDGDGKADVSVFRPPTGAWYLNQSQNGFTGISFGQSGDKIVPADYDGDGKCDVAVFRNGTWYLNRSQLGFTGIGFGAADDIPAPADYDGDGKADLAVFRPSTGAWYLLRSQLGFTGIAFGQNGDKPVAADYDGDGKADIAVNRNGIWYLQRSQLGFTGVQFGAADDKSVPADYDGDGKADIAVFRPSNGGWYLLQSTAGFTSIQFGIGTDTLTPADYDGDGKADVAVFRSGTWYLNRTTAGFTGISFGASTDLPTEAAFVR